MAIDPVVQLVRQGHSLRGHEHASCGKRDARKRSGVMVKSILIVLFCLMAINTLSIAQPNPYECNWQREGSPRHGVLAFQVTDLNRQQILVRFPEEDSNHGDTTRLYEKTGNVHQGDFAGFGRFRPASRYDLNDFANLKFGEVFFKKSAADQSAVIAFKGTKGAIYLCL